MLQKTYKDKLLIALLSLIVFTICYQVITAHGLRKVVPLGNGYQYYCDRSGVVINLDVTKPGVTDRLEKRTVRDEHDFMSPYGLSHIGPDVDGYHFSHGLIVGHVTAPANANPDYKHINGQAHGYFIIEVKLDRVYTGLSKREWLARLQSLGIRLEPELHRPY